MVKKIKIFLGILLIFNSSQSMKKSNTGDESYFSSLAPEVKENIVRFLPSKQLTKLRLINSDFLNVIQNIFNRRTTIEHAIESFIIYPDLFYISPLAKEGGDIMFSVAEYQNYFWRHFLKLLPPYYLTDSQYQQQNHLKLSQYFNPLKQLIVNEINFTNRSIDQLSEIKSVYMIDVPSQHFQPQQWHEYTNELFNILPLEKPIKIVVKSSFDQNALSFMKEFIKRCNKNEKSPRKVDIKVIELYTKNISIIDKRNMKQLTRLPKNIQCFIPINILAHSTNLQAYLDPHNKLYINMIPRPCYPLVYGREMSEMNAEKLPFSEISFYGITTIAQNFNEQSKTYLSLELLEHLKNPFNIDYFCKHGLGRSLLPFVNLDNYHLFLEYVSPIIPDYAGRTLLHYLLLSTDQTNYALQEKLLTAIDNILSLCSKPLDLITSSVDFLKHPPLYYIVNSNIIKMLIEKYSFDIDVLLKEPISRFYDGRSNYSYPTIMIPDFINFLIEKDIKIRNQDLIDKILIDNLSIAPNSYIFLLLKLKNSSQRFEKDMVKTLYLIINAAKDEKQCLEMIKYIQEKLALGKIYSSRDIYQAAINKKYVKVVELLASNRKIHIPYEILGYAQMALQPYTDQGWSEEKAALEAILAVIQHAKSKR